MNKFISKYDAVWSTNPSVLYGLKSSNCYKIYEKHGAGRYFQKFVIKKISKNENYILVGTTKTSFNELKKLNENKAIYLTNGVDINTHIGRAKEGNLNIDILECLKHMEKTKVLEEHLKF